MTWKLEQKNKDETWRLRATSDDLAALVTISGRDEWSMRVFKETRDGVQRRASSLTFYSATAEGVIYRIS